MREEYLSLMKYCGFKSSKKSYNLTDMYFIYFDGNGKHHCITYIGNAMDSDIFSYNNDCVPNGVAEIFFGINELINFLCKMFPIELRKFKIERIVNS